MGKTLIIVDMQNDFLSGGVLEIRGGDEIIPIINRLIPFFDHVIASKDWHPKNHVSFAKTHKKIAGESIRVEGKSQRLWPIHCLQSSKGAEMAAALDKTRIEFIAYKGTDKRWDSYSVFFDDGGNSTHLFDYLNEKNLFQLYFAGAATEYCIRSSVLDALSLGFSVFVIQDAIVSSHPGEEDERKSLEEMKRKGAKIIRAEDVFSGRF